MKRYRSCTITLDNPTRLQNAGVAGFDPKLAASTHRIVKWNQASKGLSESKTQLGKGSFKTVYAMEGTPPASLTSLDTDYVLAKLRIKLEKAQKPDQSSEFIAGTLLDVLAQMLVTGQQETTVYFSNLNKDNYPDKKEYRYCLYLPKLKGSDWDVKKFTLSQNMTFLSQIFNQLRELHLRGFYHSDVKPANTMTDGVNATVIDFGGLNRIWRPERCSTRRYNPFGREKKLFIFAASTLSKIFPGNNNIKNKIENTSNLMPSIKRKPNPNNGGINVHPFESAKSFDYGTEEGIIESLNLCHGIHLDMGSIFAIILEVITQSNGIGSVALNHNEALWMDCLGQCFSPPSVRALIHHYASQVNAQVQNSNPVFNNMIISADFVRAAWSPTYGIDVDHIVTTIANRQVNYVISQSSSADNQVAQLPDQTVIEDEIRQLSRHNALSNQEKQQLDVCRNALFEATPSFSKASNSKERVLSLLRVYFLQAQSLQHLKFLFEKFLYISLINRSSWHRKELTSSFETISDQIIMIKRDGARKKDPIGNSVQTIQKGEIQKIINEVLAYPAPLNLTNAQSFHTYLRQNNQGHDWVFNFREHEGSFDQILQAIENVFMDPSHANSPLNKAAFSKANFKNVNLKKFAEPPKPAFVAPAVADAILFDDYEVDTSRILTVLHDKLNLNLDSQITRAVTETVNAIYS